jgi:DNA-binding CsgD family transcriptional regulator
MQTNGSPNSLPQRKRGPKRTRAIVIATPSGRIQFADSTARRWLAKFFGRPARGGLLPRKVCRWLTDKQPEATRNAAVGKKENARLFLRQQHAFGKHTTVLLLELINGKGQEHSRTYRRLTAREREVLLWLSRGKSNAEIAAILGIKVATVSKHLERIYPKLGVESRSAAINVLSEEQRSSN